MSGMGYRGKTTNLPRETTAVQAAMETETKMGEIPGEIVAFDPAKQSATIQPLYTPIVNGKPLPMPELQEVPVRFTRAGNGGMTFPIQVGDRVTLRPQMRSSESYHEGGEYSGGGSRYQSISDMEAYLDGGEPLSEPMENFDAENVHFRSDAAGNYGIKMSADGRFSMHGNAGNPFALLAQAIRLIAEDGLNITTGSSQGVGIHELENRGALTGIADALDDMSL